MGRPSVKRIRGSSRSLWFIILIGFLLRVIVSVFLLGDTVKPRRDYWPFGYEAGRIARSIANRPAAARPTRSIVAGDTLPTPTAAAWRLIRS